MDPGKAVNRFLNGEVAKLPWEDRLWITGIVALLVGRSCSWGLLLGVLGALCLCWAKRVELRETSQLSEPPPSHNRRVCK